MSKYQEALDAREKLDVVSFWASALRRNLSIGITGNVVTIVSDDSHEGSTTIAQAIYDALFYGGGLDSVTNITVERAERECVEACKAAQAEAREILAIGEAAAE